MKLAVDTSTDYASLAITQDYEILAEYTWHCGQNHTVELYPRLDFLFQKSGLNLNSLDCIIVAKGPGSFNGLRVGVSAAKGLAFSLGIPIIGIGTLEAMAYQHAEVDIPVCAIQNAGREEIAVAIFRKRSRKGWIQVVPENITNVKDLVKKIKEVTIFCGEINQSTAREIKKLLKTKAILSTPAHQLRRAAYVAELGQMRFENKDFDNVSTLQPVYLRRPPITERKKA